MHAIQSFPRDPDFPELAVSTPDPFIPDAVYTEVVTKMVITCTDVVFTVKGERAIYLAHRNVNPWPHQWLIGGRMQFNDDTFEDSIVRCVARETGLRLPAERFRFVTTCCYGWQHTKEGVPGKNVGVTFTCELSVDERDHISNSLIGSEYVQGFGLQAYTLERLMAENCHPVLVQLWKHLFLDSE